MRKVNPLVALVVGGMSIAGLQSHAEAAADVYFIGANTDAAYWTGVSALVDGNGNTVTPSSPGAYQSQGFGAATPPRTYLATTWTYAQPDSFVDAGLKLPQVAYATGSFAGSVQPNGNFSVSGHATAGVAADGDASLPAPPLMNAANALAVFDMNFDVTVPQTFNVSGILSSPASGLPGNITLYLAEGNPDGTNRRFLTYVSTIDTQTINQSFLVRPNYLYELYIYADAGFPVADATSPDSAAFGAGTGNFNVQGTFVVPEPVVLGLVVPLVFGTLARRRRTV